MATKKLSNIFHQVTRNVKVKPSNRKLSLSFTPELLSQASLNTPKAKPIPEINDDEDSLESNLKYMLLWKDPVSRENFKKRQSHKMKKILEEYIPKYGTETMFHILAEMGGYDGIIQLCVLQARKSNDVESGRGHARKAIEYLQELGDRVGIESYEPLLNYFVDLGMVKEFQVSKDIIREVNPDCVERIGYYEMLLWIEVEDEEKIHELCSTFDDSGSLSILQEHYLDALCEKDREENLQRLLEIIDITKVSSCDVLINIFSYLGRLLLESIAMKFLIELNNDGMEMVSDLISVYVSCVPNATVDDMDLMYNELSCLTRII